MPQPHPSDFLKFLTGATARFLIEQPRMPAYIDDAVELVDNGQATLESVQLVDPITGEVRRERSGQEMTRSETLLSLLEARLLATYGEESATPYRTNSWMGYIAFTVMRHLDWRSVADWILRHYVVDYVPSEAEVDQFPDNGASG